MTQPPFQLTGRFSVRLPPGAGLFESRPTPVPAPTEGARRRRRLAELDANLHCSIIGTCLGTGELRKLLAHFVDLDHDKAGDLDIHHAAVELAMAGGEGARALNKALDKRYEAAVRRFQRAKTPQELSAGWSEALAAGEVPGAYWAVLTHPDVDRELRQRVFGDVHMLSHLVGAANRAEIRRLVALEAENQALRDKTERQQARLQAAAGERETLQRQLADASAARLAPEPVGAEERLRQLGAEVQVKDQLIAHHTQRREHAESRLQAQQATLAELQGQRDRLAALAQSLQAELTATEGALEARFAVDASDRAQVPTLDGLRLMYVGGRPQSNRMIRAYVDAAGGTFVVHDGGLEDRKGLLAAALPGADAVVFPVDCVDHDSASLLKRLCERHGVAYHPIRSASLSSFVAWMQVVFKPAQQRQPPASRFCLRHG